MPEVLINLHDICSHVVRHRVSIGNQTLWATIILSRLSNSYVSADHLRLGEWFNLFDF